MRELVCLDGFMQRRHRIVEVEAEPNIEWLRPGARSGDVMPIMTGTVDLIDETVAPRPSFPELPGHTTVRPPTRSRPSAVPGERPAAVRPSLPWGLGTDGWPRHNSRLVRLFACEPSVFVDGVVGRRWQVLDLDDRRRTIVDGSSSSGEWPQAVAGSLAMPYRSLPLSVELRCQPFQARYTRADIVVTSHYRWPRRFFDVASRCLTDMQCLERPMEQRI